MKFRRNRNRNRRSSKRFKNYQSASQTYSTTGTLTAQTQEYLQLHDFSSAWNSIAGEGEVLNIGQAFCDIIVEAHTTPLEVKIFGVVAEVGDAVTDKAESANSNERSIIDNAHSLQFSFEKLNSGVTRAKSYVGNSSVAEFTKSFRVDVTKWAKLMAKYNESVLIDEPSVTLASILTGPTGTTYTVTVFTTIRYLVQQRTVPFY